MYFADQKKPQDGELDPLNPAPSPRIPTGLVLNAAQESVMLEDTLTRLDELKNEMGLDGPGGKVRSGSWMFHRWVNERQYENDFEWRKALGGIFDYSNFSVNISKRYARLLSAKTSDDLVGSEPFFSIMPNNGEDPELAKDAEWYAQDAVSESQVTENLAEGQKIAIIRNECVMKQYWDADATYFEGPARVAVGPFEQEIGQPGEVPNKLFTLPGEPVVTPKGDYVYEMDDVIPDPNTEGLMRLQKEPEVAFRTQFTWQDFPYLRQRALPYEGIVSKGIDWRDFLCPLNVASVHEADMVAHLFDEEHDRLKARFNGFEVSESYANDMPQSGEKSAKETQGEEDGTTGASQILRNVHCADVYRRCDPKGDGNFAEVWMIIDVTNRKLVWYDFLNNHMRKRPFAVIPGIEKVPNRWYGVGVFEMLDHKQLYIDTQFNRVNWKSTKSSSLRFRMKNAVEQWRAGDQIVVGDDTWYDITDPQFDARNPPAFQVQLSEIDENAMKLVELMLQAASTEVGIVGPDDGNVSGLDSTKLATGIKSLERTGNVLAKYTEKAHGKAITEILEQHLDLILNHMDEHELVYRPDTTALVQLSKDEIRKVFKRIKLLLTRSRSTETIETARMVIQLCREYYEALNPEEQNKLRDEYIRQLKALEVQDPDKRLRVVSDAEVEQWRAARNKAPDLPPKASIATKYPDLQRSEQIQVLQREGITPAPDAEIAQTTAKDLAKTAAEAKIEADAKPKPAASPKSAKS